MTKEHAIERALADYRAKVGTIIEIEPTVGITGYNERGDSIDLYLEGVRVKVEETPEDDLAHFVDEWLDPYWNVEPVEHYPELDGLHGFWTFGPSYETEK